MAFDKTDDSSDFNDPALKSAVLKAWGSEKAPSHLRTRINDLTQTRSSWRKRLLWPIAAAIILTLLVQLKSILPPPPPPKLSSLPAILCDDLVTRHDRCSRLANHHRLAVPQTDDAAIVKALQTQLSQAVLMARPAGWVFRGAAICHVGSTPTGHLVFAKDHNVLSIFSLPLSIAPNLNFGAQFQTTDKGHPIIAFTKNGALFCLVASGSPETVTMAELVAMEKDMQKNVSSAPACARATGGATGELMYIVAR